MAETIEKPVEEVAEEVVDPKDDVFVVAVDDDAEARAEAAAMEATEAEADDEAPAEEEEAPAAQTEERTFQHPPELIEKAVNALFTTEEIAGMSPEALRTAINGAHRIAQAVVQHNTPKETATTEAVVDDLAVLDDPELYNQDVVKPIKAVLAKQAERLDKLEKENAILKQKAGQTEAQTLRSRLMAQVPAEVAKEFASEAKYAELLTIMQGVWASNKNRPEPEILQRALKAMDLAPAAKPVQAADTLTAKKNAWDNAALAKAPVRQKAETAEDRVGAILAKIRAKPNGKPVKK
jgi:hypothetical protein